MARGGRAGHWSQARRDHCYSTPLPQRVLNTNRHVQQNKTKRTPSEGILWMILSLTVRAGEAPVNGKATEKHHWPGPGITRGRGKQRPRGS